MTITWVGCPNIYNHPTRKRISSQCREDIYENSNTKLLYDGDIILVQHYDKTHLLKFLHYLFDRLSTEVASSQRGDTACGQDVASVVATKGLRKVVGDIS